MVSVGINSLYLNQWAVCTRTLKGADWIPLSNFLQKLTGMRLTALLPVHEVLQPMPRNYCNLADDIVA